ncbi:uncharacterized protein LOC143460283 [Clavelina lepadiformis]|uniref:CUB domain-containing protein n=1 Tax=Clavelina lepadiformis TaxID=159417 RepID=A0ABP0GCF6_CLALP
MYNCSVILLLVVCFSCLSLLADGQKNKKITPPKRLSPGETPVQEPGWKHCLSNTRAGLNSKLLRSPGYPKLAPVQMQCSWIIEAPIGYRVRIAFKDLHMSAAAGDGPSKSCRSAYIDVIDMTAEKSQGRFCGSKAPGDYVSIGTYLRIDLQGDKSRFVHRGFIISYWAVKERPGLRARSSFPSPSDSEPGKVNVNEFKSTLQRNINAASNSAARPRPPGSRKLMYASDQRYSKPISTTRRPNSGWVGGNGLGPVITTTQGGAKVSFKTQTPKSSGNRITAVDLASSNSNKNNGNKITYKQLEESMVGPDSNTGKSDGGGQDQYYGEHNQPESNVILTPERKKSTTKSDNGGLTQNHLIIIAVVIVTCFLIVAAVFFLRRFYCKKYKKEKGSKSSMDKEQKNENIGMVAPSPNRNSSLPGLSRSGSLRSMHSHVSFHPDVIEPSQHLSRLNSHQFSPRHVMASDTMPQQGLSRHQSLVARHNAIYNNHNAIMMQAREDNAPHRNHHRRISANRASLRRPLPPIPIKQADKGKDVDEDYCSGSDEDPDVKTLRRELSPWEMEQKKKKFRR